MGTHFQFYPRSSHGFLASFPFPFLSQMEADHRKGNHQEVSRGQLALGGIQRKRSGEQWRWEAKAKGPLRHREEYSAGGVGEAQWRWEANAKVPSRHWEVG